MGKTDNGGGKRLYDQHSVAAARRLAAFLIADAERLPIGHELRDAYVRRAIRLRRTADAQAAQAAR